ncbi:Asp23/Gls24 family envelope stress response protein [Saccharopolyspora shandongensis]|uniref:Asp23/Gls24 family envelope stress response protein n=1 Tax=Saccharopolyspora shandongensis TaxID=418495 RepID=UPI00343DC11E
MTATTGPAAAEEPGRDDDPAERGRLHIGRAVLRKIAEHTADQDPGSARRRHRLGGGRQGAAAQVSGPDDALRIRLDVALRYPSPVRETVASMRERIGSELERLTEFRVRTVDVTVSALVPADVPPRVE